MEGWEIVQSKLDGRAGFKLELLVNGAPMSVADVLAAWRDSPEFCRFYTQMLAMLPFSAIFWETPPLTRGRLEDRYEFVVLDSPQLARIAPNNRAFGRQFAAASDRDVVAFENLGGDAMLVVPCPDSQLSHTQFTHLMTYMRADAADQQLRFWQTVGTATLARLSDRPLWLSTSGLGVYWLHVRLDSRPKYYTYNPYRLFEA